MTAGGGTAGLLTTTFVASAVEFVEAFTIVLAMGVTRGWRSAIAGVAAAVGALSVVTVVAGFAVVNLLPKTVLQLVIGALLLIFGLQWLRKAILRSSGLRAIHDEEATFRAEEAAARRAGTETHAGLDWFGFVVSFKGVFLEGLEVVFIVVTFGLSAHDVPLAAAAAALAGVVVVVAGVLVHRPLSRVPENTLKFVVGLLLTTFGTFWAVEGLGVFAGGTSLEWPGGDVALMFLLAFWAAFSLVAIRRLRAASAAGALVVEGGS
jgi:uncharacterized membrane protein